MITPPFFAYYLNENSKYHIFSLTDSLRFLIDEGCFIIELYILNQYNSE